MPTTTTAMMQIASRHFSRVTINRLARRGIRIVGLQTIPAEGPAPFANGSTGYLVDDRGTGRVWSFTDVLAAAGKLGAC